MFENIVLCINQFSIVSQKMPQKQVKTEENDEGATSDEDEEVVEDDVESRYLFHLQKEDEETEKREKENQ